MLVYNDYMDMLYCSETLLNQYEWNINEKANVYDEELFEKAYEAYSKRFGRMGTDSSEQDKLIKQCYENDYKRITNAIPNSIKSKVVDLRLLALATVTSEVYQSLKENAIQVSAEIKVIEEAYQRNLDYVKGNIPKEDFDIAFTGFHDAFVIDCGYEGNNLYIKLKLDHGFGKFQNTFTKIIYENARLIEGNWSINLYSWRYFEIYYKDGRMELHIRFSGGDIVLQADRIRKESYYSVFASDVPLNVQDNDELIEGTVDDLVNEGLITNEESLEHPARNLVEDDDFNEMRFIWTKYYGSFGKLEVHESTNKEYFQKLTSKKYIYDIMFENSWFINNEKSTKQWMHGEDIRNYIVKNCNKGLELWSIWTDNLSESIRKEINLSNLRTTDLEEIYTENKNGIANSYQLVFKNS